MSRNLLPDVQSYEFEEIPFKQLMQNRIHKVLIICSNYDYYLLEEDGRIDEQIFNEYTALNLRYPPNFVHARTVESALNILAKNQIDIVIIWVNTVQKSFYISNIIKKKYADIPIVALSHRSEEVRKLLYKKQASNIDFVFHWNDNVDIFLAIIKLVEDQMNAENDINKIGVKAILLVQDSLRFYSRHLALIYRILLTQTHSFVFEGLNEHQSMMLKRGRPKVLLAKNYEEGLTLFEKYKDNLLGVISDARYFRNGKQDNNAGFHFIKYTRKYDKQFPILIQSSDPNNEKETLKLNAKFLHKHSETLGIELKKYITKYFSFGDFEFQNPKTTKIILRAKNLKQFQKALAKVSLATIIYHAKCNDFSKWLQSRALFSLAKLFSKFKYKDFIEDKHIQEFLIDSVKAYRIYRSRGIIAKFDRYQYDEYLVFSRIGEGALGGKGRGLAFIDLFLKSRNLSNKYKDVIISIPRTVVISTDVFEEFIEKHNLYSFIAKKHHDEEILNRFISKPLPNWAIKDIKAFLLTLKTPVAIRSSNVLEDSIYQPFAGVYATYMLPNTNIEKLLPMVCNAIKSVMASSFYKASKAYIKATAHSIEESKMAVILQEVIGVEYDDVFFPNISGVARSINFYPIGNEKPKEGIANIALGLGEIVVSGGRTLRFSPYHARKVLQLSSTNIALKETQKYFYGLDLDPDHYHVSISESVNKKKINLRQAKNHRALKFVASTYDMHSNQIRSGVFHDGPRILSFESILQQESFPLSKILKDLLKIGQKEIHNPIEMEFAVKLDVAPGEPKVFSFLQIRPIVENNDYKSMIPKKINRSDVIVYSESVLGNGKYERIYDFVYVKPDAFNAAKTLEIVDVVEQLNDDFEKNDKNYILVGPGRWGSSDPWLGIPVNWSQISAAKIIVESSLENYQIDPSQGTHFFQNLTSFNVGYLTINPFINDGFYDVDYLNKKEVVYEDEFIRHVHFKTALTIMLEGKNNKAVIYKEGVIIPNSDDIDIDEI